MPRTAPAYLDHAATTDLRPAAAQTWLSVASKVGNASSLHGSGRAARRIVEESREQIAEALGARPSEVVFTSGGTEADNLAVTGLVDADPRRGVLCSPTEHHSVLDSVVALGDRGLADVHWIPVDSAGVADLADIEYLLGSGTHAALITVMAANNETGTLQPISRIAELARAAGVNFHTDGIQLAGHLPINFATLGATSMSLAAHKFGGPMGVGALLLDRQAQPTPILRGGGQERDVRSGSVNVAGVAAMAIALSEAVGEIDDEARRLQGLRDTLIAGVLEAVPEARLNGPSSLSADYRLPGIAHLTFPGCEGESLILLLDAGGVQCSTGSACTAGVAEPSHVLLAMGADTAAARGSLRISLGRTSSQVDVDALIEQLPAAVERAKLAGMASAEWAQGA